MRLEVFHVKHGAEGEGIKDRRSTNEGRGGVCVWGGGGTHS
jgi:hypothetical protein